MTTIQLQRSGVVQGALWGAAAEEWASLMEPQGRTLFDAVLGNPFFSPGARVLDAGCGSGLFAELIAERRCDVIGIDASEPLLALARRRNPSVMFHRADLETLPFPDEHFDVVTGINSFQYAASQLHALAEARRVTRRGGHVVVATWGRPQACEAAAYLAALKSLLPPSPPGTPGPFALSQPGELERLVGAAGLTSQSAADVNVAWTFPDLAAARAGMLSAGPAIRAIQAAGRGAVESAVEQAIAPYRLANGSYRLENQFRYAIASRE
jgi:SAM-dependent methyltransferase